MVDAKEVGRRKLSAFIIPMVNDFEESLLFRLISLTQQLSGAWNFTVTSPSPPLKMSRFFVYLCLPNGRPDPKSRKVQLYSRIKTMRQVSGTYGSIKAVDRVGARILLRLWPPSGAWRHVCFAQLGCCFTYFWTSHLTKNMFVGEVHELAKSWSCRIWKKWLLLW